MPEGWFLSVCSLPPCLPPAEEQGKALPSFSSTVLVSPLQGAFQHADNTLLSKVLFYLKSYTAIFLATVSKLTGTCKNYARRTNSSES